MQENGEFFAIFSLEDARVASYSLRAPHNATSVIGDPAGVRGMVYPNIFGIMDIEVPCGILECKSRVLGSRDTRDGIPSSVVEEL